MYHLWLNQATPRENPVSVCAACICGGRYEYLSGRNRRISTPFRTQAFRPFFPRIWRAPRQRRAQSVALQCVLPRETEAFPPPTIPRGFPVPLSYCPSRVRKPSGGSLPRYIFASERWRVRAVQIWKWECLAGMIVKIPFLCWDIPPPAAPCHLPENAISVCAACVCGGRYEYLSGRNRRISTPFRTQAFQPFFPRVWRAPRQRPDAVLPRGKCIVPIFPIDTPRSLPVPLPLPDPSFQTLRRVPPHLRTSV
jgi:hypothetical protein